MEVGPPDHEAQLAKLRQRVDELEHLIVYLHPELWEDDEDVVAAEGKPVLRVIRGGLAAFSGEAAATSRWRRTLAGIKQHPVRAVTGVVAASVAALTATAMLIMVGGPSIPAPAPGGQSTVPLPAAGQGHHRRRMMPRPTPTQPRASRPVPARLSSRCLPAGPGDRACRMLAVGAEFHRPVVPRNPVRPTAILSDR